MKKRFLLLAAFLLLMLNQQANSQVLISLLLGDNLNSGIIEFGLEGGVNYTDFHNLDEGRRKSNFNLGFYFLYKFNEKSFLNTGVLVKENQGAEGLSTYTIGNAQIDSLFINGTLDRRVSYFQVPVTYHFRTKARIFFEAGFQLALRNGATDIFLESVIEEDDTSFKIERKSDYNALDAGILGGLGYKVNEKESGAPGMSIGVKYYYGLVDISKSDSEELFNDSFNIYVRIPIGAGKAASK